MIIRDRRIKHEVRVNVGDLVTTGSPDNPTIGIVGYEEGSDYPYFVMCLYEMEILDGYEELQQVLNDFDLYAKKEQLELIIK